MTGGNWLIFLPLPCAKEMLSADGFKGQPHLSADELLIAHCHLWLLWFRSASLPILATAFPSHGFSERKKNPLTLETPVTEPLFSLPRPVPVPRTNAPEGCTSLSQPAILPGLCRTPLSEQIPVLEISAKTMEKIPPRCYLVRLLQEETFS